MHWVPHPLHWCLTCMICMPWVRTTSKTWKTMTGFGEDVREIDSWFSSFYVKFVTLLCLKWSISPDQKNAPFSDLLVCISQEHLCYHFICHGIMSESEDMKLFSSTWTLCHITVFRNPMERKKFKAWKCQTNHVAPTPDDLCVISHHIHTI